MRASSFLSVLLALGIAACETASGPAADVTATPSGVDDAGTPAAAPPAPTASDEAAAEITEVTAEATAEITALEARVRELQASIAEARAKEAAGGEQADVEGLMRQLELRNGQGMLRATEPLLLAGEPGWKVLHDFFRALGLDRDKLLTFTRDPQLVFASLNLVARHPEQVAALAVYLMRVTRDQTESPIRREIYNFVPVLINHHPGRFPELRAALEEDILYQLEQGGEHLNQMSAAMRDIDFYPPPELFVPILTDETRAESHSLAVSLMAQHGEEGIRALVEFVREHADSRLPSLNQALGAVGASDDGSEALAEFLAASNPLLRAQAHLTFFNSPRGVETVPIAREYLASTADARSKRALLQLLRRRNPAVLAAIVEDPSGLPEDLRQALERLRTIQERPSSGSDSPSSGSDSPSSGSGSPSSGGDRESSPIEKTGDDS